MCFSAQKQIWHEEGHQQNWYECQPEEWGEQRQDELYEDEEQYESEYDENVNFEIDYVSDGALAYRDESSDDDEFGDSDSIVEEEQITDFDVRDEEGFWRHLSRFFYLLNTLIGSLATHILCNW